MTTTARALMTTKLTCSSKQAASLQPTSADFNKFEALPMPQHYTLLPVHLLEYTMILCTINDSICEYMLDLESLAAEVCVMTAGWVFCCPCCPY